MNEMSSIYTPSLNAYPNGFQNVVPLDDRCVREVAHH